MLVKPRCSGNAFSMVSSSFAALLDGLSKMTLPLEITVLTFSNPSFSKTPRNLSLRILGFVGAIPRKSATYRVIVCFYITSEPSTRLLPIVCSYYIHGRRAKTGRDQKTPLYTSGVLGMGMGCPHLWVQCRMATTSRYSAPIEVVPSVAVLCSVHNCSSSARRADCFSASSAPNALWEGP